MKKTICIILALALFVCAFAACNKKGPEATGTTAPSDAAATAPDGKRLSVVTTIFPEYDWVRNIAGDKLDGIDLTLLLDNGADLHSYQPTFDDIMKVSECDLFIYVGGESDKWVDDVLKSTKNDKTIALSLLEALGDSVKEEETKEGMEAEEEEEGDEEGPEYDEHVWLSLKNSAALCNTIAAEMGKIDAANAQTYKANADSYIARLNELDAEYRAAVDGASVKTLLFADRFPFRYLVDDYGLDYYAAFSGCSAEAEASFETISFLSKKVDELGLKAIMQIETADGSISKTVKSNTKTKDQQILTINSIQSVSAEDVADGASYLEMMRENLTVLKEALGKY